MQGTGLGVECPKAVELELELETRPIASNVSDISTPSLLPSGASFPTCEMDCGDRVR